MGRHINTDVEVDTIPASTMARTQQQGTPLAPQAVISPDTHVGVESPIAPGTPDAAASPARPDSLIQHGLVGDGHELE
jgi:hypothetical protein